MIRKESKIINGKNYNFEFYLGDNNKKYKVKITTNNSPIK